MELTRAILVTGANRGIGKAIVEAILDKTSDTLVYLGSRDRKRGDDAVADIQARKSQWKDRVVMLPLDVGSDSSVDSAASIVRQNIPNNLAFYGIVNNAGVGYPDSDLKPTLNINVRGIKRVVEAFGPLLPSEGGRVVNHISSRA